MENNRRESQTIFKIINILHTLHINKKTVSLHRFFTSSRVMGN